MPGKSDYYKTLVQTHGKMDEHPFDYSRRFSSVVVQDGEDGLLIIKGSIDEVVRRCRYAEHAGNVVEMEVDPVSSVHAVVDEMLEDGMKVIAVAYKHLTDDGQLSNEENDFILLGYINLDSSTLNWLASNLPQSEFKNGIEKLMQGEFSSLMVEADESASNGVSEVTISCGSLVISERSRRASRDGNEILLTPKEFDILLFLAKNRGQVFTKEQIYQAVWESDYVMDDSNIMAFIRKLRKKIEACCLPLLLFQGRTPGFDPAFALLRYSAGVMPWSSRNFR